MEERRIIQGRKAIESQHTQQLLDARKKRLDKPRRAL
jgi:hypothetical protein